MNTHLDPVLARDRARAVFCLDPAMTQLVSDHELDSEGTYLPFGLAGYARLSPSHELELVCGPDDLTRGALAALLHELRPQLLWARSWQIELVHASGLPESRRIHLLRAPAASSEPLPHADLSHVSELAQLEAASYQDTPYRPLTLEQRAYLLSGALQRGETILFTSRANAITGFAWLLDDFGPARSTELHVLAVHPDAARGGFGARLVMATQHEAASRGAHDVELYCDITNTAAQRLYQRLGFVNAGHDLVGFLCQK